MAGSGFGGFGAPASAVPDSASSAASVRTPAMLFALANAGITLDTSGLGAAVREPVTIGVVAGLVLGKPLGVLAGAAAARATRLAPLPDGVRWAHLAGVGLLAGIGFTVSLFIAGLAFPPGDLDDAARLGILIASLLAGAAGAALLTLTARPTGDPSTPAGSQQDQPDAPASHAPSRDAPTATPDAEQSPA